MGDKLKIAEKLRDLRQKCGLSQKDVAKGLSELGYTVNNAHVSRWENGANRPSIEHFIGICQLYGIRDVREFFDPGFFPEYLVRDLNEEGQECLSEFRLLLLSNEKYRHKGSKAQLDRLRELHEQAAAAGRGRYRTPASRRGPLPCYEMGPGNPIEDEVYKTVSAPVGLPADAQFAVIACGDSMAPEIESGERVWFAYTNQLENGETGLVSLNGSLLIRRYISEPGRLEALVAANPAYEPFEISSAYTLKHIGRLIDFEETWPRYH